jgi:hypothetical protein
MTAKEQNRNYRGLVGLKGRGLFVAQNKRTPKRTHSNVYTIENGRLVDVTIHAADLVGGDRYRHGELLWPTGVNSLASELELHVGKDRVMGTVGNN